MIYEMRTYDLKPRSLPKVLERWAEAIEYRKTLSPLGAFWYTEIGPLNQIIHVWPYPNLEERNRVRAEAVASGKWPPKASEHIVQMRSEIMMPWPGSPELPVGKVGPYFEMRTYTMSPGDQPKVQKAWNKVLAARTTISPVIALWFSEIGGLNKFVHVWPYASLDARVEARKKALAAGIGWPPTPAPDEPQFNTLAQETKILLAAPFSPLQ